MGRRYWAAGVVAVGLAVAGVAWAQDKPAPKPPAAVWEYKVVTLSFRENAEGPLNKLAGEGWELVNATTITTPPASITNHTLFLRRAKR